MNNIIIIDKEMRQYDRAPDECPICHHAIAPRRLEGSVPNAPNGREEIRIAYKCTLVSCRRMFVATYDRRRNTASACFYLRSTEPKQPKKPNVSEVVSKVSPQFVIVLGQAAAAESYGLDQVAGVGFRKALEFLVKDYCVAEHPDDASAVKGMFLSQVIDLFVDSENIKNCAKRAAWLGNDETHYVRRWEGKDIEDLKILIQLTEGWIRDHLLTREYFADMQ